MKYEDFAIRGYRNSSIKTSPKINKELNQRDFNPGWGMRGRILSKIYEDSAIRGHNDSSIKISQKVNKRLNQRNFNPFVLPCPGWGVRGGTLSKIKELLTFNSILIGVLPYLNYLFLIWGKR